MPHRAFTLIELMAVIVLLGLLAGAAAWSLAGGARRAGAADTVERIGRADQAARLAARRTPGRSALRIDLDDQTLTRVTADDRGRTIEESHPITPPAGFRIDGLLIAGNDPAPPSGSRTATARPLTIHSGSFEIPFSTDSRSPTYALHLTMTDPPRPSSGDNRTEPARRYLLVAGLTGQVTEIHEQETLDILLQAVASRRPDSD